MSDQDRHRYPPEVEAILEAAKRSSHAQSGTHDDAASQRIWSRLNATLALPGLALPTAVQPDPSIVPDIASPVAQATGASSAQTIATAAPAAATVAKVAVTATVMKSLPVAATIFALGAGTGAGMLAGYQHVKQSQIERSNKVRPLATTAVLKSKPVDRVVPTPSPAPQESSVNEKGTQSPAPETRQKKTKNVSSALTAADSQIAAERAVLEMARMSLIRGDTEAAMTALRQHRYNFSSPRLSEERDVLLIQAFIAARDVAAARQQFAAFKRRYPASLFASAIAHALAELERSAR